jgi:beta-phosphoglucomutase-like phosphatase (HAD superfamily)/dTDP-glucose pyrophosphorylase
MMVEKEWKNIRMNKLVIFDLDGVMIDSREMHYETLNAAIIRVTGSTQYVITREEHLSKYDGLNTTRKLQMLTADKGMPVEYYNDIWSEKQKETFKLIPSCPKNSSVSWLMDQLKNRGWKIAVASNSIRETVKIALNSMNVIQFVDYFVSNEDVFNPKPFPEMYWQCMTKMKSLPKNTIIIEDSHIGREGALNSGAHLYPVKDAYDLEGTKFLDMIDNFNIKDTTIPWRDEKLNVLIPMAGAGSRFAQAGYTFPKPLIEVNGKPMIQVVVENLNIEANYIFLVQKEHYEKYNLKYLLNLIAPNCTIVQVDGITEGAACTTLLAKEFINNDAPLIMANSDQYVDWNSNECLYAFKADSIDGGILTFHATHPKWSYAKLDENGFVSEVAEKKVISDQATVGVYYWNKGSDYVKYAEQMIDKNIRTNNEFYVAPVFNEAIEDGKKIRVKEVPGMWGIGTPEDLNYFLTHKK